MYRKKYITSEENNITRVFSTTIILLIFMNIISFLYVSNEECFTFIIHHVSEILDENPEVIDTYYPWSGGSIVYPKIYPAPYVPLYGSNTTYGG